MKQSIFLALTFSLSVGATLRAQPSADVRSVEFFETKIRPILAANCFSCHSGEKHKGGVRLDRKELVLKQSDEPIIVPGHPEKSLLVKAIKHEIDAKMPPPPKMKRSPSMSGPIHCQGRLRSTAKTSNRRLVSCGLADNTVMDAPGFSFLIWRINENKMSSSPAFPNP